MLHFCFLDVFNPLVYCSCHIREAMSRKKLLPFGRFPKVAVHSKSVQLNLRLWFLKPQVWDKQWKSHKVVWNYFP